MEPTNVLLVDDLPENLRALNALVRADSLVRCVAEKMLSAFVPGRDNPAQALAHDCVVGGFDDRCKKSCSIMSRLCSFHVSLQLPQTALCQALVLLVI